MEITLSLSLFVLSFLPYVSAADEFCDNSNWNVVKGTWVLPSFQSDASDCSAVISNTNSASGNIIWFGSNDGLTPDTTYDIESFTLQVVIAVNSDSGDAGIIFRGIQVSSINDQGQHYYIGLYPSNKLIRFGRMNNDWTSLYSASYPIDRDVQYVLRVEATGNLYKVYIDDNLVLNDVHGPEYTYGSIGYRTFYAPATYYSLMFTPQTYAPTHPPTVAPTSSPAANTERSPTASPTDLPTIPTNSPTVSPTRSPTPSPTKSPNIASVESPTQGPDESFTENWQKCIDTELYEVEPNKKGRLLIEVEETSEQLRITLTGPITRWFGIGFGADTMNNTFALIINGDSVITAITRILGDHFEGEESPTTLDFTTKVDVASLGRIVSFVRPWRMPGFYHVFDFTDFFQGNICELPVIWAQGNGVAFSKHQDKGVLALISCFCDETTYVPSVVPAIPTATPSKAPALDVIDVHEDNAHHIEPRSLMLFVLFVTLFVFCK